MGTKQRKEQQDKVEFSSYTEYLNNLYPDESKKEIIEDESAPFGSKLAEESLRLMRKLLSEKKISCVSV
jgi:hypothetical protein